MKPKFPIRKGLSAPVELDGSFRPVSREPDPGVNSFAARPGTILLVSDDIGLHQSLRSLANERRCIVVRVGGTTGTVQVLRVVQPDAVLLDLDLSQEAAWSTGETLLRERRCPPLLLMTGSDEQFDFRTAIRAGSVLHKTAGPARMLEVVQETLALPLTSREQRNALQLVLIRWLRPRNWSAPSAQLNGSWRMGA